MLFEPPTKTLQSILYKIRFFRYCEYCGEGTRCFQCTWLVIFCRRKTDELQDNEYHLSYKHPYIEMWTDILEGVKTGKYTIDELLDIYEENQEVLIRDCEICFDYIRNLQEIKILYEVN